MKKVSRAQLRGLPLEPYCKKANTTTNNCGIEDKRVYCYGLYNNNFSNRIGDWICDECKQCKAFVNNITPLENNETSIKDLEDELGISFSVLYLAMTRGFYCKEYSCTFAKPDRDSFGTRCDIALDLKHKCFYINDEYMTQRSWGRCYRVQVNLKDYGKTWFLTYEEYERSKRLDKEMI